MGSQSIPPFLPQLEKPAQKYNRVFYIEIHVHVHVVPVHESENRFHWKLLKPLTGSAVTTSVQRYIRYRSFSIEPLEKIFDFG